MNKKELKKDYIGLIASLLRKGDLNHSLKETLSDRDAERACEVEEELAAELERRYQV